MKKHNNIEDYSERILDEVDKSFGAWQIEQFHNYNKIFKKHQESPEDYLEVFLTRRYREDLQTITLLTHPDMAKAWKSINTRIYRKDSCTDERVFQLGLYMTGIMRCLSGGSYWETITPSAREHEYGELIESLKEVAQDLERVEFRDPALGLMDKEMYSWLQFKVGDMDHWEDFSRQASSVFYSIPMLLKRYAYTLQKQQRQKNVLIDRPNSGDAAISLFSRSLYMEHIETFGSPLYEVISTIAGIFYPDHDTSSEKIRASIRSMK